ncbi:hypothetical protein HPB50_017614 [Hyalomma asiaticum]|uniref:Uncharacterized protein n=1 Tax=Hyalomma asiaticum TaxID=266040 RepID=A0ACB7TJU2_HYAAI|nr:hypothetical protein HPB50_017614 [Hyalomma asiaticum]
MGHTVRLHHFSKLLFLTAGFCFFVCCLLLTGRSLPDVAEPVLPAQDGLSAQFASRIVYVLAEVDERRLNPTYWLSAAIEDTEQEPHQIRVDLVTMMERTLPEFNLNSELDKLVLPGDESVDSTKSPLRSKRKPHTLMGSDGTEPSTKKPFIAPMRGRGLPRVSLGHQSRANDPFRSRPPNTSRPPSTHVDDFVHQLHQRPPGKASARQLRNL